MERATLLNAWPSSFSAIFSATIMGNPEQIGKEEQTMWILVILAVIIIWQIGIRATVKGIANGTKKTVSYIRDNRKTNSNQNG